VSAAVHSVAYTAAAVVVQMALALVFQQSQFGKGAAVLNVVFLALLVLSAVYLRGLQREEDTP
jgi:ABC-type sugar transport system permease subunit